MDFSPKYRVPGMPEGTVPEEVPVQDPEAMKLLMQDALRRRNQRVMEAISRLSAEQKFVNQPPELLGKDEFFKAGPASEANIISPDRSKSIQDLYGQKEQILQKLGEVEQSPDASDLYSTDEGLANLLRDYLNKRGQ